MMVILHEDSCVVCATWQNMLFAVWKGALQQESLDQAEPLIEDFARQCPGRAIEFVIVREGVPIPGAAARKRLSHLVRRMEPNLRAAVFVYEGRGIGASAIRAAAVAMITVSRAVIPSTFVSCPEDGIRWLVKHGLLAATEASELPMLLDTLRDRCT